MKTLANDRDYYSKLEGVTLTKQQNRSSVRWRGRRFHRRVRRPHLCNPTTFHAADVCCTYEEEQRGHKINHANTTQT